jgi:glucosamine-6-phosphate deaminase
MSAAAAGLMPEYLLVESDRLGMGSGVVVRIVPGDMQAIGRDMARVMLDEIRAAQIRGRAATFIVPVGPVDQYPILASEINQKRIDCRELCLINMDEYLTDDDQWVPIDHPLSFRGYMDRMFYNRLDPALAPRQENRIFPDPRAPDRIQQRIESRGGVDVCFGGIGINGHIAFNEPPEAGVVIDNEAFAALPTRALDLTGETRTINSVTVGGEIAIIPHRAVTVGMKECLCVGKMRFYCNRPWQSAVVRRALHGPVEASCPASFLRRHADAEIAVAEYVADRPDIRLR